MINKHIEIIEYIDSYTMGDKWKPIEDMVDVLSIPMINISVGWVLKENDTYIMLCPNFAGINLDPEDMSVCGMFVIPKVSIISRKIFENINTKAKADHRIENSTSSVAREFDHNLH